MYVVGNSHKSHDLSISQALHDFTFLVYRILTLQVFSLSLVERWLQNRVQLSQPPEG